MARTLRAQHDDFSSVARIANHHNPTKPTASFSVFCKLPQDELLNHIFSKLDFRTLARVEECCSRFRMNGECLEEEERDTRQIDRSASTPLHHH